MGLIFMLIFKRVVFITALLYEGISYMENNIFYCYSDRLYHFLSALGFRYESIGVNNNTNKKYRVYNKSEQLDSAIELYNSIKHKYN